MADPDVLAEVGELTAELGELARMIAMIPAGQVLDIASLEGRRQQVIDRLWEIEDEDWLNAPLTPEERAACEAADDDRGEVPNG